MTQPDDSVSEWIAHLREKDESAVRHIWERYYERMVRLARRRLGSVRRAADEEDVALAAFDSFCRAIDQGRFPRLNDRDDLWHILVCLTDRKAFDQVRSERRTKRGGGKVVTESALDESGLAGFSSQEPSPDFASQLAEESQRLLGLLGDEQLRNVAIRKLEGHSNKEIAELLCCALRTVERKLNLIRELWKPRVSP